MTQLTLTLKDETVKKAEQVAEAQSTSLPALIEEFVESVASQADDQRAESLKWLTESFSRLSRPIGPRTWRREDLYER